MNAMAPSARFASATLTAAGLRHSRPSLALLSALLLLSACGVAPARPSHGSSMDRTSPAAAPAQTDRPTGDAQPRYASALALLDQQQTDQAEATLISLVHDYPQLSGPATELGLLYLRSNRKAQATQSFEQALRANPQNTVALNCLGILYRQRGDFARAEQSYLQAIALKPDDAKAHLNLGILYELSMHQPRAALEQYRAAQKYSPQDNLLLTAWVMELDPQAAAPVADGTGASAVRAAR